jgi:hypothetical protein
MIAVLPAISIDYERDFSNLTRVKTNNRNRLGAEHLESLIRIISTEMDELILLGLSKELIKVWKRRKDRRIVGKADTLHV